MSLFTRTAVALALLSTAARAQQGAPAAAAQNATSPASQGRALSLEEALRIAEGQSETMRIAQAGVLRAQGQQVQARSQYLPQLNGSLNYTRTLKSQFEALRGGPAPVPPSTVPPVPPHDTTTYFTPCTRYLGAAGATEAEKLLGLETFARCSTSGTGGIDFTKVGFGSANQYQIGVTGAVLQMFSHGVMTALVFLMIGALYDQAHTRDLKDFGGIAKVMPLWVIFYSIAGLANVGLPGLSGFTAEFHIFVGTFRTYPVFGALAIFSAALAAAYMLRMFGQVFFGPFNARWSDLKDLTPLERLSGGMLIASIVFMGVWWAPFIDRVSHSVTLLPGVTG